MKYTPKRLKGNVNVSRTSPVKELFLLLGGVLGIIIFIYAALGIAVDLAVTRLPVDIELKLGSLFSLMYKDSKTTPAGTRLQLMLDGLVKELPPDKNSGQQGARYKVYIIPDSRINAMALPGGNIIVFSALIKDAGSDNELSFVLAHELGHFANRDHLRGLGRRIVLLTVSAALFGGDSRVTNFIMNSLLNIEMKFSQRQETMADLRALDLLNKKYGHVSGATDFFEKMSKKEKRGHIAYYFATHPYPDKRIEALQRQIREKGHTLKEKTPLNKVFSDVP